MTRAGPRETARVPEEAVGVVEVLDELGGDDHVARPGERLGDPTVAVEVGHIERDRRMKLRVFGDLLRRQVDA